MMSRDLAPLTPQAYKTAMTQDLAIIIRISCPAL